MPTLLLRRFLHALPVLAVASFVLFLLIRLAPGDPALIMAGGRQTSPAVLDAIRAKYQLNDPVLLQYWSWISHAARGDLGESYRLKQSVSALVAERLPLTFGLVALSMFLSLAVAIPLGVVAARWRDSWLDRLINTLSLAALASPVFLTGILGVLLFSYTLGWLPSMGSGDGFADSLRHLILPASALALNMLALSLRITRNGMIAAFDAPYIRTARMKGLSGWRIIVVHALRNALVPLLTVSGLQIGFLLTGTVLVEYTFGLAGLGSLLVNAIQSSDFPLVQGVTLFVVAAFLLINLAVDLLYGLVDPRMRHG